MSKMLLKSISLTIDKENYNPVICKQMDTGRYLLFQLLNNGVPFALTGRTVRVYGVKKDGSKIFNDLKIIDGPKGICELQLTSQILFFEEQLKLDLTIYQGNDTLSLIPFTLDIRRSLRNDYALESTNEFSALTISLAKIDEWNKYFEETSGKIEEKYTVRLNELSSQMEEKASKVDLGTLSTNKADKYYVDTKVYGMSNLNQEVKEAMTGGSVPVVGTDAIDNINYKNNSITRNKMRGSYNTVGTIAKGTDLKTIVDEGLYFGELNGSYINMPSDMSVNRYFELKVEVLSDVWAIQILRDFTEPNSSWSKTIHRTNITISNPWVHGSKIKNSSVSRLELANNFSTVGSLDNNTDINLINKSGVYLGIGTNTYLNIPKEVIGKSFVLNVYTGNTLGRFCIQEITEHTISDKFYRRYNVSEIDTGKWNEFISNQGGSVVSEGYFKDKTFLMFGDSITENGDYPERVGKYLGCAIKKAGFGGCRMAQHTQSGNGLLYDKMCMHKLSEYIKSGDFTELVQASEDLVRAVGDDNRVQAKMLRDLDFNEVDYITILFATNDFGSNQIPIGINTDDDETTFKGSINKTIKNISEKHPTIKIMFITPFYRNRFITIDDGKNSDDFPNELGIYLQEYVDAIKEVCKIHHIPVLDLMDEIGINKYNQATYLVDGLHPTTEIGYGHLARKITSGIEARF
ncbi:MAG: GDSL-type esterase/lipase family protein [Bacilli bacterium]